VGQAPCGQRNDHRINKIGAPEGRANFDRPKIRRGWTGLNCKLQHAPQQFPGCPDHS